MKTTVTVFTFNAFQENTYIISDNENNCVIIDPGCYEKREELELQHFIAENHLNVLALLNTHAHIDHVLGNDFVKKTYNAQHYLHVMDIPTLQAIEGYAVMYGFEGYKMSGDPDVLLQGNESLKFGNIHLEVLFTPGHAPGHVVFYNKADSYVINGDVLFNGSFGRVDLPGGDLDTLKKSIFNTMFSLPEETIVYCGHGPSTTIKKEKLTNYILNF